MAENNDGAPPGGQAIPGQVPHYGGAPGSGYGHAGAIPGKIGGGGSGHGGSGWITADAFSAAWQDVQRIGLEGLVPFLFVIFAWMGAELLWGGLTTLIADASPFGGVSFLIGGVGSGVIQGLAGPVLYSMALATARQQSVSMATAKEASRFWPAAIVASVALRAAVSFTVVICGLGLFLAVCWSLYLPALVNQNLAGVDSLRESWNLSRGRRIDLVLLSVLSGIFCVLGLIPCGLGLIVIIPLCTLATTHFYLIVSKDAASEHHG